MTTVHSGTPGARAWAAAQVLAAALRSRLTQPVTGRRWRRRPQECPWWCASDHRCTARHGYPSGEHRSKPLTWRTPYGVLIATRVQTLGGVPHLDLRASVRLAADEESARWQGQHLPVGVDLTIRAITAPVDLAGTGDDRRAIEAGAKNQGQEIVAGSPGTGPLLPPSPVGPAARKLAPIAGPPCQLRRRSPLPLKAGAGQGSFVEPPAAALPAGAHALA